MPTGMTATGLAGEFDCDEETPGTLVYSADDIELHLATDEVLITPREGGLDVGIGMTLWSDDAALTLIGDCVLELDESCVLGLPPTALNVELDIDLILEAGQLHAQVDHIAFTHGNFGNPIDTGCVLGDAIETMQGYGVDLLGSILDQVLEGQVEALEEQLEEALGSLTGALLLEDSIDVLDTALDYRLQATTLDLSSTGLKLGFEAMFSTPTYGDCVPWNSGPYQAQSHDMPALTGVLPGTGTPYHLGILINEDLINQALYVAWQGGLLCLNISDLVDFELNTGYLSLIDQELVESLWSEPQTLNMQIRPVDPPAVEFSGGPEATAELLLDVYGNELDRVTRFWANRIYAEVGLAVDLADNGNLDVNIEFDLDRDLGITVDYNEWLPAAIPSGFTALIPDLVASFIDIEGLSPSIALPAPFGVGLGNLETVIVGDEEDYLGIYARLDSSEAEALEFGPIDLAGLGCDSLSGEGGGEVSIPGCETLESGCNEELGCGTEGGGCGSEEGCGEESDCAGEGGCAIGPSGLRVNSWGLLCLLVPLLIASRRRR
ncbi:MAG: hypothetical protein VX498_04085, partial [Myxococcota bacterium]|nr:hypothetical protein [Myxococcota bacterium]